MATGDRFIALGDKTGVTVPANSKIIAHTQPGSGGAAVRASVADEAALARTGQKSSVIINDAGDAATRFRPTAQGDVLAKAETGPVKLHAPEGGKVDNAAKAGAKQVDDAPIRPSMVDGRPQHYFDEAGTKGNWRKEINGRKLEANADYHVNGYKFSTDAKGRVDSISGELTLAKAERNGYQQGVAGRKDRLPDDQGGHLIASIFNGPGEAINLKAMNGSFNMKEYRDFERLLETEIKAGKKVEIKIDVKHLDGNERPDKFIIEYKIDGIVNDMIFRNKAGG
jgi:DNA/RNA non-specific endonuclease